MEQEFYFQPGNFPSCKKQDKIQDRSGVFILMSYFLYSLLLSLFRGECKLGDSDVTDIPWVIGVP